MDSDADIQYMHMDVGNFNRLREHASNYSWPFQ